MYIYDQEKEPHYEVISNPVDGLLVVFAIGSSRIEIVNQLFVQIQHLNTKSIKIALYFSLYIIA